ncbi:MAG: glucosyltransferase domain-containing protein [Endomicrobium sp.]|jgi:hypothetical protein|nr:glucosyltransferase domain-containing protein [Endomicrobium sp.]
MIDLMENSIKTYRMIPKHVKKSFLIIFISMIGVFSFFLINYIPGREDWGALLERSPLFGWEIIQGRYFTNFLPFFLFDGNMGLPILNRIFSFFLLSLASVMLCMYWKLPKRTIVFSLVGLSLVLQPYILAWFFYLIGGEIFLTLPFFIMSGFFLCEKAANFQSWHKFLLFIGAVLCFWFVLGIYPVIINTIAVVFFGRLLIDFISSKDKNLRQLISYKIPIISVITVGMSLHYVVILWLQHKNILVNDYNSGLISMSELPFRCLLIIKTALKYLYDYNLPFFSQFFTSMWTFLLFLSLSLSVYKFMQEKHEYNKRFFNIILMILFLFITLFVSFSTNLISKITMFYVARTDFFGIAFFHVFILTMLFKLHIHRSVIKNIIFLCCISMLFFCVVQDFRAQKIWYFGFEVEKQQWMRIINRIETTPTFEANKMYKVLILGTTLPYRPFFYTYRNTKRLVESGELLNFPFMASWGSSNLDPLNHYSAYGIRGKWRQIPSDWLPNEFKAAAELVKEEIFKAEPWPASSSVQIKDDIILVVLDKNDLEKTKSLVKS